MTHISITGDLGSGKSTIAKNICRILDLKYLSTGSIQRELAAEMGMNTLEFNKYSNENKEIDQYIDQKLLDINDSNETYVLDSRLAWHFVKKSFKIYVMAMDEVAAKRVMKDTERKSDTQTQDLTAKMEEMRQRREIENVRFEKIYGIRPSIFQDFDIIIDTSTANIEQITDLVIELYKKHCAGENYNKIWLSPIRLLPTQELDNLTDSKTIGCFLFNRNFYILTGHHLISQLILNNQHLIPVKIIGKNEEIIHEDFDIRTYLSLHYNQNNLEKWEIDKKIKFLNYPSI